MGKKALLVVDMLEDFLGETRKNKDCKLYDYDKKIIKTEEYIERVNKIIDKFKNDNDMVIYIDQEMPNKLFFRKVFGFAIKGTKGAEKVKSLYVVSDNRFTKMFGNAFTNRKLNDFLKKNNVDDVYIVGIDATKCSFFTAKGSIKKGYNTFMVKEGLATIFIDELEKCEKIIIENSGKYI